MNQKERMLAGLPYRAWQDGLEEERTHCKEVIYDLNHLHPRDRAQIPEILKALFGRTGEDVWLEPPFHCDYGWNIEVGDHFFANYNLTILDVGKVTIGSHVRVLDVDEDVEEEYTIVGSQEANPMESRISDDSPFGRAMLGKHIGQTVEVEAPVGTIRFEILSVER